MAPSPDWPDYCTPISLYAVEVEKIPIDIVAQTIGTLSIDIKAQTLAQLNVNIAACAISLNVKTAAGESVSVGIVSSVQLNVNLAASAITVNVHETGTASVSITSSVQLDINIAASAISLNVKSAAGEHIDTDIVSSIQLSINIAASAITLAVHEAGTANVAVTSSVQLNVNIAASGINVPITTAVGQHVDTDIVSSVTINVAIQSSAVTLNVAIQSSVVTLQVNIASQSAFNLNVNIAASAVTLNVAIQSSAVTLNVNLLSQSVDINIKTSGGANIIIDKLMQSAYVEDRRVLINNGATPSGPFPFDFIKGKFFPRGARGFINVVYLYLQGADVAVTITVSFRVAPNSGEVFKVTYVLSSGAAVGWKSISINRMWNYDSMFIKVSADNTAKNVTFEDAGTPYDSYQALYATPETYTLPPVRYWFQVSMTGMTVGDLPVSGTLNVIHLPNLAAESHNPGIVSIPANTTTTLVTHTGSGRHIHTQFGGADENNIAIYIYADDVLVLGMYGHDLQACGFGASTPDVSLIYFAEGEIYYVWVTARYPFKRQLRIAAHNSDGVNAHNAQVLDSTVEMIS